MEYIWRASKVASNLLYKFLRMIINIKRFINELMSSNCYLVVDEINGHCICIDPASEQSLHEIDYIEKKGLSLDYIILTHEHTDHTWGVNSLLNTYPNAKVVCSRVCMEALPKESKTYFRFYYDDPNYSYNVLRVDYTIEELEDKIEWFEHNIFFYETPGHSPGSIVIEIDGVLFGGDTLMPFKPFIKKRNGGSKEQLINSIKQLKSRFALHTIVYPGHGEVTTLEKMIIHVEQ